MMEDFLFVNYGMEETWKPVVGYESLYQISNTGKVKSVDKIVDIGLGRKQFKPERILKAAIGSHGYYGVALCKDKVQTSTCIHKIIAEAFIPNQNGYRCVNHKDGNKLNNSIDNLEWCTHKENSQHAYDTGIKKPFRKVSTDQVRGIRALKRHLGLKITQLAAIYEVNNSTINQIVNLKSRING